MTSSLDSFKSRRTLTVGGKTYAYFSLAAAEKNGLKGISRLPYSLKVLLENLLRHEDGKTVTADDIKAVAAWLKTQIVDREIAFRPARVLMQDLTGVPAVVDLAAMRDAMKTLGGDPEKINPLAEVDLVIDHSVMVDNFGTRDSFKKNVVDRISSATWSAMRSCAGASRPSRISASCRRAPASAIRSISNISAQTVWTRKAKDGKKTVEYAFPDTLVGTDSHTTMVNGLSVLGWGVGGIEAEAAMLGQPISMLIPEVIGFTLTGKLREGVTATDLVLTVTQMLRKKGVVGKFVEFYGPGLDEMALEDRATIANMAPEYGATCGFFPIDAETLRYLKATGAQARARGAGREICQGAGPLSAPRKAPIRCSPTRWRSICDGRAEPRRSAPAAGSRARSPTRRSEFATALIDTFKKEDDANRRVKVEGTEYSIGHGDVVIAAITSCTNTSNPERDDRRRACCARRRWSAG